MLSDESRALELFTRVPFGRVATSMRALPFVAPCRHVLADGVVLLRIHAGLGYHQACAGSVVAYGADNFSSGESDLWSVQFTGIAEIIEPADEIEKLFGPGPHHVDGEPLEAVYMRVVPQFVTLHVLEYSEELRTRYAA